MFAVLVLAGAGDGLRQRLVDGALALNPRNQCARPDGLEEAQRLLGARRWDVILWQADGQFLAGLGGLQDVRRQQPDACIVAVAREEALGVAARALGAGADAYMPAGEQMSAIFGAVVTNAAASAKGRQRSEDEQRELGAVSERLQVLGDISEEAMFACRSGGAIVHLNRGAERLTGRVRRDILGTGLASLFRPGEVVERAMAECCGVGKRSAEADLLTGTGARVAGGDGRGCLARQPGGSYLLVRLTVAAVGGEGRWPPEVVAVARPVVHDEAVERELAEVARCWTSFSLRSPTPWRWWTRRAWSCAPTSRWLRCWGLGAPEACVGKPLEDLLAQEEGGRGLWDALGDGRERVFEARVRMADRAGSGKARVHVMPVRAMRWSRAGRGRGGRGSCAGG